MAGTSDRTDASATLPGIGTTSPDFSATNVIASSTSPGCSRGAIPLHDRPTIQDMIALRIEPRVQLRALHVHKSNGFRPLRCYSPDSNGSHHESSEAYAA